MPPARRGAGYGKIDENTAKGALRLVGAAEPEPDMNHNSPEDSERRPWLAGRQDAVTVIHERRLCP
jgi:hypothetical protein